MKFKSFVTALLSAALATSGTWAFAQAHITGTESATVYVNGNSGSDSNPGSESEPFKTIGAATAKALANNQGGIGTLVLIEPGVYRELVQLWPNSRQTTAPITLQAVTAGTAVIDGADALTGWYASSATEYSHDWKETSATCSVPAGWPSQVQPIVLRTDMVFVNGTPLTQVLASSQMQAGTFYVDGPYQKIRLWPPAGTDMNTAVVEVASRPETVSVYNRSNITLRGLVLRHATSCIGQNGASISDSSNVLIDGVQAIWNNWGGLNVTSSRYITVQNSIANNNGGVGITFYRTGDVLLQSNTSNFNNWRGAMGGLYNWAMGGTKLLEVHRAQVNQQTSENNQAQGLWFDTDNSGITINGAMLASNTMANLMLEADEGPITFENSTVCSGSLGVSVNNVENFTLSGNTFYGNGTTGLGHAQFLIVGPDTGRSFTNWETGQAYHIYTSNMTIKDNIAEDNSAIQYLFNTFLTGSAWTTFADSFHSSNNQWYDPSKTAAFTLPGGHHETLAGWQNVTGQDTSSNWSNPSGAAIKCSSPAPAYPDFHVNTNENAYSMAHGTVAITLQLNSFNFGTAKLSVAGLPQGVSSSFSTSALSNGASVLTLKASQNAKVETVPVTIIATSGSRVHSVTVRVSVAP